MDEYADDGVSGRRRRAPARAWQRSLVAAAVLACASLTACGDDDAEGGASTPADDPGHTATGATAATGGSGGESGNVADEADPDGEMTFVFSSGVTSFDPHRTPSFTTDQIFQRQVYDSLLTIGRNADGEVELVPQLATSYEYSKNGQQLTFELRSGVKFHDGTPFNAQAVKANIERALDAESTVSSLISSIDRVEVVDKDTAVFHLSEPDPSVAWSMATGTTGNMASPAAFDTDLSAEPVGTGPFQLESALQDAEVTYTRWDEYWDPDAALLEQVTISTIPDVTARYNGLQSGEFDAAYLQAPLDFESEVLEEQGYHRNVVLSPISIGLLLNSDKPPFDDVRVRKAVDHALNRQAMSETVLNGLNPPTCQPFNEGFLGHDPELDVDPYDVDRARELIEEAGAEGATVEIMHSNSPPNTTLAPIVQAMLSDIGLDVELRPMSTTEARPSWRRGSHQAAVMPIIAEVAPSRTLASSYLSADNPGTPPQELVQLADDAATAPPDSDEQVQAYQAISAYLVENPIHVPIAQFTTVIASRPDVVGSGNLITTGIADLDFRGVGVSGG